VSFRHCRAAEPAKSDAYEPVQVADGWKAMQGWERHETDIGWRFVGECPRCKHRSTKSFPRKVLAMKVALDLTPTASSDENVVRCDCGEPHSGREATERGCGAYWGIEIRHEPGEADG
jgi:hypothetical protein